MPSQVPQLLVNELIKRNLLTPEALATIEQEMAANEKDFGELLIAKSIISDPDLLAIKSEVYQLPTIDASTLQIDKELSKDIPENIISLYRFAPLARDASALKVGLINPENIDSLEALKFIASDKNLSLEKYLISYKDFEYIRQSYRNLTSEVSKALESLTDEQSEKVLKISEKTEDLTTITAEAPITRIVAAVVKHAVDTKTSDIHIEPFDDIRIRYRIDGELQTMLTLPINLLSSLVTRIKILSDLKIDETRLAQDGRFSTKLADRAVDFRVSTLPTRNGEKVVLRILDPLVGNIQLPDLGLQGRSLTLLTESMNKPYGAILITGPTGSGKSTTLAAILRQMNNDTINIVTLEDPIEYYVAGVNQSQIHEEIGYTFANGLRHILRQDPDVVMVGEIRDRETAGLATQAALTGHIVLSTLHTNDTIGVIPRLVDMGVEKYLLAPTLNMALAQRLVRKLCPTCKKKEAPNPGELALIKQALSTIPPEAQKDLPPEAAAALSQEQFEIYKPGEGCTTCNGKFYKGRIGIYEVLAMNDEIERIILTNLSEEELRKAAHNQGMLTMYQDGIIKVLQGVTSMEEVLQAAQDSGDNAEQVVRDK